MKVGGQRWIDGTDARMENEGVETHKEGRVRTTHSALMKPREELFQRKKAGRQAAAQQKDGLFGPAAADCGAALTHGPTPSGRAVPMQKHPSITEHKMPSDSERLASNSGGPLLV